MSALRRPIFRPRSGQIASIPLSIAFGTGNLVYLLVIATTATMKNRFLSFLLIAGFWIVSQVFLARLLMGQSLIITGVDASGFPEIKANFYAFDNAGKPIQPSQSDLKVSEDQVPRVVRSVSCPATNPVPISSVLAIDISGSMATASGKTTRMLIAQGASKLWVQDLILGPSECAVTSFDDYSYVNQDLSTDQNKLLSAIDGLSPNAGTDYDQGFANAFTGALPIVASGKHKRVVIFLTDGIPNETPETANIIAQAKMANITIYVVCIALTAPHSLADIAAQTNGEVFDNVTSLEQAQDIYDKILHIAQGSGPCTLTWQSASSCSDGAAQRNVEIDLFPENAHANLFYAPPPSALHELIVSPFSAFISGKPSGKKFDTTITVTAQNAAFAVSAITSSNSAFDVNPKSFTLAAGQSKALTLSYTPPDESFQWAEFEIQTDLCPEIFYSSGGLPGSKPKRPTLKLLQPNGGEVFRVGIDTSISWAGIPSADTVKLDYSIDSGKTWITIADSATGLKHGWHVPRTPSVKCLARVRQIQLSDADGWIRKYHNGTTPNNLSGVRGIDADDGGNCYVAGVFFGMVNFAGITLSSTTGNECMFLVKFNPDGTFAWARQAPNCSASSIAVDHNGSVYVAGSLVDTSNFEGTIVPIWEGAMHHDLFIVKYRSDGTLDWAKGLGGNNVNDKIAGVRTDPKGNAYLAGSYSSQVDFGGVALSATGLVDIFLSKYHSDGSIEWARHAGSVPSPGVNTDDECYGLAVDTAGSSYLTGTFQGTINFGGVQLLDIQKYDGFIAKYRADGSVERARGISGGIVGKGTRDEEHAIGVDLAGNAYVIGTQGSPAVLLSKYSTDGNLEWSKSGNFTLNSPLAVDGDGNIYTNANNGVAKYTTTGSIEWIKLYLPGDNFQPGNISDVAVDNSGFIYTTGSWSGFDFPTRSSYDSLFVRKMSDETLQSDISDSVFSIVKSIPISQDVNMGTVLAGTFKDNVVSTFIRNAGSYPFEVESIDFGGTASNSFSIVSGIPPFTVPPRVSMPVEFRFIPYDSGLYKSTINILIQDSVLIQNIQGVGVRPLLKLETPFIDFDTVDVGKVRDSVALTITNISTFAVTITNTHEAGPNIADFSAVTGAGAFTLAPNASRTMTLRFAPSEGGRTSGRILFDYNGPGSPAVMQLFGTGIRRKPEISAPSNMEFGRLTCQESFDTTITISNSGEHVLDVSNAVITGVNGSDFSLTSSLAGATIEPDSFLTISLRFRPSALGSSIADLEIHSDADPDSVFHISLEGAKDSAGFVADSILDLGDVCPNATVDTAFVLANTGTIPIGIGLQPPAELTAQADTLVIPVAGKTGIRLHFDGRTSEGTFDDSLVISDSICNRNHVVRIRGNIRIPHPVITVIGSPTICDSGSVILRAPLGFVSYLWQPNSEQTDSIVARSTGLYSVTVTDSHGCIGTSLPISIRPDTITNIAMQPGGLVSICLGDTVELSVPEAFTEWSWNDGTASRTRKVSTPGVFWVSGKTEEGCFGRSQVTTVIRASRSIHVSVEPIQASVGDMATLSVYLNDPLFECDNSTVQVSFTMNTDILTPIAIETDGTLLAGASAGTILIRGNRGVTCSLQPIQGLAAPLDLTVPLFKLRTQVYLSNTLVTPIIIDSFRYASKENKLAICTLPDTVFSVRTQCGDQAISTFIGSDKLPDMTVIPNPLSGRTTIPIRYELPVASGVHIDLVSETGLILKTLHHSTAEKAGSHEIMGDLDGISSGRYFLVFSTTTGFVKPVSLIYCK